MLNFESWIFCLFSSNTGFFLVEGLFTPQKLENKKIKLQISILEGVKQKKWRGGFHWRNRSQNFRFSKCYDICFYHFCEKHPLMGKKRLLKSEKNILQISHLIFWMLQAAKYLIHDFTFTFPFFFICSKLNWPLFHLSEIFACKKMMDKVEISIWNIWMWRKWEAKVRNP